MKKLPSILALTCIALAPGCSKAPAPATSPAPVAEAAKPASAPEAVIEPLPKIDTQSPDAVVRTYWALKDWRNSLESSESQTIIKRDILEVKSESETRFVVVAKITDTTPIPDGHQLTDLEREKRDFGTLAKYVVEKGPDGWRLTQAWYKEFVPVADAARTVLCTKNAVDTAVRVHPPGSPPQYRRGGNFSRSHINS